MSAQHARRECGRNTENFDRAGQCCQRMGHDHEHQPQRDLPLGMAEQLDLAHAGLASFGHRPFLTELSQLDAWQPDVAIVGAPFDVATTNRPGARFGPRAIRATAYEPGTYHMDLGLEIFDWLEVVDFGDAYCPHGQTEVSHANIKERVHAVASRGIVPVVLGGDHSITWPSATAVADVHGYGNVGIVHFDAHADTADIIEGNLASHGTPGTAPDRVGRGTRNPLRPGRFARVLAAAGHLRVDAGAGHGLAHHAGDLGARLQGCHARRRR
jgi:Arginase family